MNASLPAKNDKFENLLDLEFEANGARAQVALQGAGVPPYRMQQMREAADRAKAARDTAVNELTFEELCEFNEYRTKVWAYYAQRES